MPFFSLLVHFFQERDRRRVELLRPLDMRTMGRVVINDHLAIGDLRPNLMRVSGQAKLVLGTGDQKRVVTPRKARDDGASVLVIGRPISRADDPAQAARAIEATL